MEVTQPFFMVIHPGARSRGKGEKMTLHVRKRVSREKNVDITHPL
jgi:hypothetical protein